MKLLIITGSPRKNGNSFAMADAFVESARNLGHSVTRFDAAFMHVEGCRACQMCYKNGKACVFDDDFNKIAPVIEEADGIIFAMPVYWYSIPAQIKVVIDKLFAFYVAGKDISGKKCALISCCAEPDRAIMNGIKIPYEKTAALIGWQPVGEVLVPGVSAAGEILKTNGIELAKELAENF